ncbi:MAG: integrase [Betaproteobacteria bacterium]|nr:integrase [Betaproteobacteria bacterium]
MAEIVLFTPRAELDAEANLAGFVAMARDHLTVFGADLPFQHDTWDVTETVATKAKGGKRERITFSTAATVDDKAPSMMQQPFLSFAKAYVRYMHGLSPTKAIHGRLAALRALEAALAEKGAVPDPVHVDSGVLNRAAQLLVDRFSDGAAYRAGQQLEMLSTFMAENRLTAVPVRWRNSIKRPAGGVRVGKEADERRADKMPSQAALEALPRVFLLATEPADVITASAAALMLSAPDRISEVLALPEACEVREPRKGKEDAYGLRWWPAKGADPGVKWVVPSMTSVVQEALRKIRGVTEEARRIAKWYEEHPGWIYLAPDVAHLRGREWLSLAEVAEILGFSDRTAANTWCRAAKIATSKQDGGKRVFALFADVEKAVLDMLPRGFPILDEVTGLKYSEALFVVRRNELGAQRGTYRCMLEAVGIGQINTGLGSRAEHGHESVFSRLGFTEPDGSLITLTSHQFRHYLNTLAQAGGLSQLDIAKWSGRKDIRQNEAYDHLTPGQMLQKIRDAVGDDNQMFGPLAELPKRVMIRRDDFARLVIPTAHTTDLGYCVHDYTSSPCQLHADCIHCQDLVCVKGDAEKTAMLRQRLDEARGLLDKAEVDWAEGYSGADRWTEHQRSTVERLSQLVEIMDDPAVPDGAVIQLATPQMPSRIAQAADRLPRLDDELTAGTPAGIRALMGG